MKAMKFATAALIASSLVVFGSSANAGEQWIVDLSKGTSSVGFDAVGKPKMLKIHGKGGSAKGKLAVSDGRASGKATFDLNTLDTGIEMRNSHMKEKYLEVAKHPTAVFELVEIKLPNPLPAGNFESDAPFKGKLTVHGATQVVSGTAKIKRDGSTLSGDVTFSTTVKGFNIDIPSFAGITMADQIDVKVEFSGPLVKGSSVAQSDR